MAWADGATPMIHAPKHPKAVLASSPLNRYRTVHTNTGVDGMGGVVLRTGDTVECDYTNSMSVGCLVYMFAAPGNGVFTTLMQRSTYTSESVNTGWTIQIRPPDDGAAGWNFMLFNNWGFASYSMTFNGNLTKGLHHIVGTTDGTTRRLYVDGVQRTTSANASCASGNAASGMFVGGNTSQLNIATVIHGFTMRRVLTADEIKRLWDEAKCDPLPFLKMPEMGFGSILAPRHSFMAFSGGG